MHRQNRSLRSALRAPVGMTGSHLLLPRRARRHRRAARSLRPVEQALGHPADVAALDADLAQELVDQRRLGAEAQGRIDDAVGQAAADVAAVDPATAAATAAAQPVDMEDLDALDALHRLDRLADDGLELVD